MLCIGYEDVCFYLSYLPTDSTLYPCLCLQKRKVVKLHVMKGPEDPGLSLFGGKHSKAGDIGIFIREIQEGSWVQR